MKILGISSNYHDASAALVIDGKVVAAAAEERFTREKHDPSFPNFAINFCLSQAKLNKSEIDFVAYHEDPITKFSRNLSSSMIRWPNSLGTFIHSMSEMITAGFWIRHTIAKNLDIHPRKVKYISHHLSHAAHSFLTSPFEKSVIVTLDAVGEWTSTGIFVGNKNSVKSIIEPLEVVPFPSSLGLVYSAFTGFLGFKVNSSECSTMALAAFGKPTYANEIRKIIKLLPEGLFKIDLSYFDFSKVDGLPLTEKFIKNFGKPRNYKNKLPFSCFGTNELEINSEDQRFADIAASIQLITEEAVLHVVERAKKLTGAENLCISGGVALNCVANGKILSKSGFKNVYCPPDPGDGGGAMGAALYLSMAKGDLEGNSLITPFMGENPDLVNFNEMMEEIDPANWHRYTKLAVKPLKKNELKVFKFQNQEELIKKTADLIQSKKMIGWVQGRFENGPRALGARSILIDPSDQELAMKLSTQVKLRANFRPYACSLTIEEAKKTIEFPDGEVPLLAKWMLCNLPVTKYGQGKIQAAMHIDFTTRPQVVYEDENKIYYELLKELGRRTGFEGVLNTSFNEAGMPIVNTPTEALISFARTSMDALVIGNFVIEKIQ
jgi:carbamoyltransferase